MLVLAGTAVALASAIALVPMRSIAGPISKAVKVAQTVASGDLTFRIEVRRTDEAGQLLTAFQRMNPGLAGIVDQFRRASDSIATVSTQIAAGSAELRPLRPLARDVGRPSRLAVGASVEVGRPTSSTDQDIVFSTAVVSSRESSLA